MMGGRVLTLRRAIILALAVGLVVPALLISGPYWLKTYDQDVQKRTLELLRQNADILTAGVQEPLRNGNRESVSSLLDTLMRNEDVVRVAVTDDVLGTHAIRERPERRVGFTASAKKPVIYQGISLGSIQIEVGSARLIKEVTESLTQFVIALGIQILLSILLIMALLERRLIGPLQRLGLGAERLAARQLDIPFMWIRMDEIGWLSQKLEATRISLRNLFDELGKKNQELEQDLDTRKHIEQQLQEREERFRVLVEQSPIAIIEWDIYYCVLEWNAAAEQIFGYSRERAIGQHASFIIPNRTEEQINQLFRKFIAGVGPTGGLSKNSRSDGTIIYCQWSNTHIAGKVGRASRLVSMCSDITEQRRAEEAYHLSQAKFASAFNGSPDYMSISRLSDGTLVDINDAYQEFTGFKRETTLGKSALDLGLWPYPAERAAMVEQVCRTGVARDLSIHLRAQNGEIRTCVANANTFNIGNELHMLCIINDLTEKRRLTEQKAEAEFERERAEEALRSSEQQFAAMFHASPVSMTLSRFDGDRHILDVNVAFERLFLRRRELVIGRDALELSLYCDVKDRESVIYILQQNGHIDRFETWMHLGDGSKALVQLSGNIFELGGEKFIIFTGEDVTEKHLIENEILELNANLELRVTERTEELQQANEELGSTLETLNVAQEELVRSEKLAALGALVAGIAHELNTPIGNSLMVASTLIDRTRAFVDSYGTGLKRSMLDSYVRDASKAGEILVRNLYRAADLVTSFKQVAVDQTSSQRRVFSLSEMIAEIMLTLSPTFRKTPFAVVQSIPKKIQMDSYPGPLGQVINNLVNNALIHAFDGRSTGTISITAQPAVDGWLELKVKDDGAGILPANVNRIFDPFFTTKLGAGGSGLGLNITHNIVTSVLGGRIRVQSSFGLGTTFILSLPATAP